MGRGGGGGGAAAGAGASHARRFVCDGWSGHERAIQESLYTVPSHRCTYLLTYLLSPLLLTGVRHHPPGRTDKNLSADVSVPRLAGFP